MKINSVIVTIEKGKVQTKSKDHEAFMERFFSQWDGQKVRLEVSEMKSKRTNPQNNYYWFYLRLITEETGNDVETLHSYFKGKFLTQGISQIYGDKVRITKSTASLSKGEFCEYLVEIAGLTGVELPDTTEYFGYSYHK